MTQSEARSGRRLKSVRGALALWALGALLLGLTRFVVTRRHAFGSLTHLLRQDFPPGLIAGVAAVATTAVLISSLRALSPPRLPWWLAYCPAGIAMLGSLAQAVGIWKLTAPDGSGLGGDWEWLAIYRGLALVGAETAGLIALGVLAARIFLRTSTPPLRTATLITAVTGVVLIGLIVVEVRLSKYVSPEILWGSAITAVTLVLVPLTFAFAASATGEQRVASLTEWCAVMSVSFGLPILASAELGAGRWDRLWSVLDWDPFEQARILHEDTLSRLCLGVGYFSAVLLVGLAAAMSLRRQGGLRPIFVQSGRQLAALLGFICLAVTGLVVPARWFPGKLERTAQVLVPPGFEYSHTRKPRYSTARPRVYAQSVYIAQQNVVFRGRTVGSTLALRHPECVTRFRALLRELADGAALSRPDRELLGLAVDRRLEYRILSCAFQGLSEQVEEWRSVSAHSPSQHGYEPFDFLVASDPRQDLRPFPALTNAPTLLPVYREPVGMHAPQTLELNEAVARELAGDDTTPFTAVERELEGSYGLVGLAKGDPSWSTVVPVPDVSVESVLRASALVVRPSLRLLTRKDQFYLGVVEIEAVGEPSSSYDRWFQSGLDAFVGANGPALHACYRDGLAQYSDLHGRLSILVDIRSTGFVTQSVNQGGALTASTLRGGEKRAITDTEVGACLFRVFSRIQSFQFQGPVGREFAKIRINIELRPT